MAQYQYLLPMPTETIMILRIRSRQNDWVLPILMDLVPKTYS